MLRNERTFVSESLHLSVQVEGSGHEGRDLGLWDDEPFLHAHLLHSAMQCSVVQVTIRVSMVRYGTV